MLDTLDEDSILRDTGIEVGDAVVSVNDIAFNSMERFVALLYDSCEVCTSVRVP